MQDSIYNMTQTWHLISDFHPKTSGFRHPKTRRFYRRQRMTLRMYTGLVFLDLRTFRAGQRLLPRDLTGNRIPAIILSLSRKPGPGFSKIRHLLFDGY